MSRCSVEVSAIKDILKQNPQGMTVTEIAAALSRNKHSVGRYLDTLRASGAVEMRTFGMAKVFSLARRIPISELFGSSFGLIMALDAERRIVQVNERFLELLGMARDAVIGRTPEYLPIPDPAVQEMVAGLLESSDMSDHLKEIRLERGEGQYFGARIFPTRFEDDTPGTIVAMMDITENVRALEQVREREEMFRGIAENIQDGLIVCEGNSILFVNRKVSEILGYPPEELHGMNTIDLLAPEERKKVLAAMKENPQAGGLPSVVSARIRRKDGSERFIEARMSAVEYGGSTRRFILITDMTEWKERFDALSRKTAFMETLFDAFPRPVFIINPDGRIEGCNTAFVALVGVARSEFTGKELSEGLNPALSATLSIGNDDLENNPGRITRRVVIQGTNGTPREYVLEKYSFQAGDAHKNWIFGILLDAASPGTCFPHG
jgi:PAS domain S-box-containing protein